MKKCVSLLGVVVVVVTMSACLSSRNKLPKNLKSKKEIYDEHFKGSNAGKRYRQRGFRTYHEEDSNVGFSFVRHSKNETRSLFKRLPNPDLVLYIFPHVKGREQTPVPGYTTIFPMYTEVHYAMPGEAPVNTPMMKSSKMMRADMKGSEPRQIKKSDALKVLYR